MDGALTCERPAGAGWLPVWAGRYGGTLQVEWCHFGDEPLREPFFQDSVTRAMRRPVNQLLRHRTPIESLERLCRERPGLPAAGFVFHASRCGSTLVAQLLAATRGSVVVSEAPPVDPVLGACDATGKAVAEAQRAEWLQWMLAAFGQPRAPEDRRLFVKFDAWHAIHLPLVRRAFPDVPWVFLYRDPREVLASQRREPGAFLVPGALDAVGAPGTASLSQGDTIAERLAGLLRRSCEAAGAALGEGGGLLVNFAELPGAFPGAMARHFGLDLDAADRAAIDARAREDAKSPGLPYERRADTSPPMRDDALAAFESLTMPAYRELERKRVAQRG